MVRKLVTWVLVADGAHARIFVNDGVGKGVQELEDRAFVGSRLRDRDIQADKPGRSFDSHGQGRHAMEPRTDPQQHEEREFVRDVIDWIAAKPQDDQFDRLVLMAAPHALGDPRAHVESACRESGRRNSEKPHQVDGRGCRKPSGRRSGGLAAAGGLEHHYSLTV